MTALRRLVDLTGLVTTRQPGRHAALTPDRGTPAIVTATGVAYYGADPADDADLAALDGAR